MYVWDETIASRGADEVASCLSHYIKKNVTTSHLIMYSDQCGGQNKNIKMSLNCLKMVSIENYKISKIDHKFLVSGHSYLRCDQDFGLIERNKKYFQHIYVPNDWIEVIKTANKKVPFEVVEMKSEDFISSKLMTDSITHRHKDQDKNTVEWFKIQWLKFEEAFPSKIFFKYSINPEENFSVLNIQKRSCPTPDFLSQMLAYPNGRKISVEKQKDLIELLQYIPPIHHEFYENLQTQTVVENIIFTESEEE